MTPADGNSSIGGGHLCLGCKSFMEDSFEDDLFDFIERQVILGD
jgi:hypothetical protein